MPLTLVDLAAPAPGCARRYGADLVLVRPDQHVAWRGDGDADPEALLARVTGRPGAAPAVLAEADLAEQFQDLSEGHGGAEAGALEGRRALVTGASGGIGGAVAGRWPAPARTSSSPTAGTARRPSRSPSEVRALGRTATVLQADLAEPGAGRALVERVLADGPLDVLVANAGTGTRTDWREVDDDVWDRTLQVNLTAVWQLTRAALPGHGRARLRAGAVRLVGGRAQRRRRRPALRREQGGAARADAPPRAAGGRLRRHREHARAGADHRHADPAGGPRRPRRDADAGAGRAPRQHRRTSPAWRWRC